MTRSPLVSVIIPDKYRPEFTLQAIQSVNSQHQFGPEITEIILIIDNNPNYPKKEINKIYPHVRIYNNMFEEGPGGSRSTGLVKAHGKFISFLDSDDQWRPDFLSTSVKSLESSNSAATMCLVSPHFEGHYPLNEKIKVILLNMFRQLILILNFLLYKGRLHATYFWACHISHSLIKREAIKKFHFDYSFRYGGEDWSLFVCILVKFQIKIILASLVKLRYELKSSTNQVKHRLRYNSYNRLLNFLPPRFKSGVGFRLIHAYINSLKS